MAYYDTLTLTSAEPRLIFETARERWADIVAEMRGIEGRIGNADESERSRLLDRYFVLSFAREFQEGIIRGLGMPSLSGIVLPEDCDTRFMDGPEPGPIAAAVEPWEDVEVEEGPRPDDAFDYDRAGIVRMPESLPADYLAGVLVPWHRDELLEGYRRLASAEQ